MLWDLGFAWQLCQSVLHFSVIQHDYVEKIIFLWNVIPVSGAWQQRWISFFSYISSLKPLSAARRTDTKRGKSDERIVSASLITRCQTISSLRGEGGVSVSGHRTDTSAKKAEMTTDEWARPGPNEAQLDPSPQLRQGHTGTKSVERSQGSDILCILLF